jgi:phage terminase Nu1 subunit (DNA packaging protein)
MKKMAKKPQKISDSMINRDDAAELCGMSARHFNATIQPLIPARNVRGNGRSLQFVLGAVVEGLLEYRLGQQARDLPAAGDDQWLKRWRKARAQLSEMELKQKGEKLVDISYVLPTVRAFGAHIRRAIELLQQRFGPKEATEIADAINAALEVAQQQLEREMEENPMDSPADISGGDGSRPQPQPKELDDFSPKI